MLDLRTVTFKEEEMKPQDEDSRVGTYRWERRYARNARNDVGNYNNSNNCKVIMERVLIISLMLR